MKPNLAGGALAIVLLIVLAVAYSTFFIVYETRQALVVRLGQLVRMVTEPGLNAKIPFIDSVIYSTNVFSISNALLRLPHHPAIARPRLLLSSALPWAVHRDCRFVLG
jgi:regulator of protease activity HflC (stomatin/prohibitin superfamily)